MEDRQRLPPNEVQEGVAAFHSLVILISGQQLGDPAGRLFYQAQIVSQDCLNGPKRQAMRGSKFTNCYPLVFLNGRGNRSHGVVGPLRLLWME